MQVLWHNDCLLGLDDAYFLVHHISVLKSKVFKYAK